MNLIQSICCSFPAGVAAQQLVRRRLTLRYRLQLQKPKIRFDVGLERFPISDGELIRPMSA